MLSRALWCLLLLQVVSCRAWFQQDADWIVRDVASTSRLVVGDGTISIENGLLRRTFRVAPCFTTVELELLPTRHRFLRALAPESTMTLNGTNVTVGSCLGQPSGHTEFWDPTAYNLTQDPAAMVFQSYATSAPVAPFPWVPGTRHTSPDTKWPTPGLHLTVYFAYPKDGPYAHLSHVTVALHYEIYDGIPLIRKWVTASVAVSGPAVVVDALQIEHLRAPNFAPDQITVITVDYNNPTPRSQQVVPLMGQSFPGRSQQFWFTDPDFDACCDQELHVPYTYYTYLRVGYGFDVNFGGVTGPGTVVTLAEPFTSMSVRLLLHDTTDWERQGLGMRKMQSKLAPQLMETPLYYMITDISSTSAFQLAIRQASEAGFELVIVGFGANGYCGMCFEQLNDPKWVAWFKEQVDYGRTLGVGVSAYTLMQHNGWGESVPASEQVLNRDGSRGGIACFATDWHANYRAAVLKFAATVGLSGVETDGQYEGAACSDASGDHHHNGVHGAWHAQLFATTNFNSAMKGLNIYQTGADAYYWSGANHWNHADTDGGYHLSSMWERLTIGREYVYDSTTTRLHSSGAYGIGSPPDDARVCGAERLMCMDYALASFFGQGVIPTVLAPYLWNDSDPDSAAIKGLYTNWTRFYTQYRAILGSAASLHLARPTSRSYEATAHVLSDTAAVTRAFVTLYNPTTRAMSDVLMVSMYYAGLPSGTSVVVQSVSPSRLPTLVRRAVVGSEGGLYDVRIDVSLPPKSYRMFTIETTTRK